MRKFLTPALESSLPIDLIGNRFVFLGGTVGNSSWRTNLIANLDVSYFNPVVENWTSEDKQREEQAKACASHLLYVITPKQEGAYSYVEMAVSICENRNKIVIVAFINDPEGGECFTEHQMASNAAIADLLNKNGSVQIFTSIKEIADYLNVQLDS
jgi:hypothetical protein